MNKLCEIVQEYEDTVSALRDKFKAELEGGFKEFCTQENLQGITWDQYAPYFNDGDPCVFHVYYVGTVDEEKLKEGYDKYDYDAPDEVLDFVNSLPEDFLQRVFGDDCTVTYNVDTGFSTEACEHD